MENVGKVEREREQKKHTNLEEEGVLGLEITQEMPLSFYIVP